MSTDRTDRRIREQSDTARQVNQLKWLLIVAGLVVVFWLAFVVPAAESECAEKGGELANKLTLKCDYSSSRWP